jgi:hypothetical protein
MMWAWAAGCPRRTRKLEWAIAVWPTAQICKGPNLDDFAMLKVVPPASSVGKYFRELARLAVPLNQ